MINQCIFLLMLLFGQAFVVGGYLGIRHGFTGYIVGVTCAVLLYFFICWLIMVWRPRYYYPLPRCRSGNCEGYDQYDTRAGTILGWEWHLYRYRCQCAQDIYVRKGRKFMLVLPDETSVPYKKLVGFRQWIDDKPAEP